MRKLLLTVCCALFAILPALSDTYTADFYNLLSDCNEKYTTSVNVANIPSITNQIFTITLSQGTNGAEMQKPRWFGTGSNRYFGFYNGNTMTIKLNGTGNITKITFTGTSTSYAAGISASAGTVTKVDANLVWTGDASEVTFTGTGTNRFLSFSMDYTAQLSISDAPVFTPPAGTYVGPLNVTLSAKDGAAIYYTTDGSTPTTSSAKWDGTPIKFESYWNSVKNPYTVKAIAVEPGNDPSIIVSASYTVLDGVVCNSLGDFTRRKFDMTPGTSDTGTLYQFNGRYTVVYQNGPSIYITDGIDGLILGAPTAPRYEQGDIIEGFSGTFYCAAPFTPQLNCTAGTLGEPVGHENFTWPDVSDNLQLNKSNMSQPYELMNAYIDYYKAETSDSFRMARFADGSEILIYNIFSNLQTFDQAVVLPEHPSYYNVKGFVSSTTGGGNGTATSTGVVCFVPVEFIVAQAEVASAPVISPAAGEYKEKVTVSIVVPTGTTVYYTTDGTAPSDKSTRYTEPFTLTRSAKVRAVAIAEGKLPSIIVEADYTVRVKSEAPEFSPAAGTYHQEVTVTLNAPDEDAYIYYTLDGTEPTYMSNTYLSPFTITETTTVKAIAVSIDQDPSDVVTATYTITDEPVAAAAPVFTPATGNYTEKVEVSIAAAEGAVIYYTLDGTEPTEKSTLYDAPFTLTETTTVKAIATENGKTNSEVVEATYTITGSGITTISADAIDADAVIYDFQGRRVAADRIAAGFYIMVSNGQAIRIAVK